MHLIFVAVLAEAGWGGFIHWSGWSFVAQKFDLFRCAAPGHAGRPALGRFLKAGRGEFRKHWRSHLEIKKFLKLTRTGKFFPFLGRSQ